jgi:biopolymer transport protein ExbD
MRLPAHHGRIDTDVAMTPMIDVVFQLLIFFICTASFQQADQLLPMGLAVNGNGDASAPQENTPEPSRIIVQLARIDGETQWIVDDRPADSLGDVRDVLGAVAQNDRSTLVTLDVAGAVPLGDMIDVYDLCRLAGLERIEFAVSSD